MRRIKIKLKLRIKKLLSDRDFEVFAPQKLPANVADATTYAHTEIKEWGRRSQLPTESLVTSVDSG